MADYISREAVIQYLKYCSGGYDYIETETEGAINAINAIPTADVVEVVRCKDCKLMCHDEFGYWCINDYQASLAPEKDYCSRAIRRADNGK